MPKGRSQDACGFQGNRPSAAPLSLLGGGGGEWVWLAAPKDTSCPLRTFSLLGKQQGAKWRGARLRACPPRPARLGGGWCSSVGSPLGRGHQNAPGMGWGVVPSRTPSQRARGPRIPPLRSVDAPWRAAGLREGPLSVTPDPRVTAGP